VINLKNLSLARRTEIVQMERGIRGDGDGVLWTTTLRASTRGGKCKMMGEIIDEPADN